MLNAITDQALEVGSRLSKFHFWAEKLKKKFKKIFKKILAPTVRILQKLEPYKLDVVILKEPRQLL